MRWFGSHWGAPVCDSTEHEPTPEGALCTACTKPIKADDDGFLIPQVGGDLVPREYPWHKNCLLTNVLGPDAGIEPSTRS